MREIPVTDIGHPLVDRVGTGPDGIAWSVTESRAPVIHLSTMRVNLLSRAAEQGRRVVLVTDEHSCLTPVFASVWRDAGGAWVVRAAGSGLRDGFTGRVLDSLTDVWRPRPMTSLDDVAVGYLRPVRMDAMQITAIVSIRLPARTSTVLGGPVSVLAEAVLGEPPRAWGLQEPIAASWDRQALTRLIRDRMPTETAVFVGAPDLAAVVSAQRTRHGIEETTQAEIGLERPSDEQFSQVRRQLDDALRGLAAGAMPLVGLLLARPARRDLLVPPFLPPPPVPLSLLIGPPAVRSFDLDPQEMRDRFDAEVVGRPRVPGLLFGLGAVEPGAWSRLNEILASLDPEQLDQALGGARSRIHRERSGRPGGQDGTRPAEPADGHDAANGDDRAQS